MTNVPRVADIPPGSIDMGEFTWEPWTPWEVTSRLQGVGAPWCVAAGWAIDLFAGPPHREHEDIEIVVPRGRFREIQSALGGFRFDIVGYGVNRYWPIDDPAFEPTHQTWVREPDRAVYRLDVFREPHDADTWICRRDPEIRLPYTHIIRRTADAVPYLAPEIVLLFKAKAPREKDDYDLARALPLMQADSRAWLVDALRRVHPGHRWLERI